MQQARKITAQFTRINDLFTYLSDDQLNLVARDHLVNLFNYTNDQAVNATEEYLNWLANKGSEQLKLELLRDTLLPHEVETAKLPAKTQAKALKPAKTRKPRATKAPRKDKGSIDAQKDPIATSAVITTNEVATVKA
jgi:hypothetical protein